MPKRKKERGRPMEHKYPPRIDATPSAVMAGRVARLTRRRGNP